MRFCTAVLAGCLCCGVASADSLTAVCSDPAGRILGQYGDAGGYAPVDDIDGMKDGVVTIIWDPEKDTAQVVSKGSAGRPNTDSGFRIFVSEEQVSFLVLYPEAIWVYSLYPQLGKLLITQHTNGSSLGRGGAVGKLFQASCDVAMG